MHGIALVVGGTNTTCALFRENKIIKKIERPTHSKKGTRFMIKNMLDMISEVKGNRKIAGIGIGSPGIVDNKTGIVIKSSKLKWKNLPITRIIKKEFKTKVFLENDAKCAALGVLKVEKTKNFVLVTLGTGLGGAIIINGKLYTGIGSAGEFGHSTIEKDGIKCHCGNKGCLEEYVSARGFERLARKYFGKKINAKELQKMTRNDKKAKRIYEEVGKYLGIGLANIGNYFNPEVIYLTGKISKSGSLLLKPARKEMVKRIYVKPPRLKIAKEGAELYGAASLVNL